MADFFRPCFIEASPQTDERTKRRLARRFVNRCAAALRPRLSRDWTARIRQVRTHSGRASTARAVIYPALAIVISGAVAATSSAQSTTALPRVRSSNAAINAAIAQGVERSPAFRHLIATIDATDGLVYIEDGSCRRGVAACLALSVTISGPHRLLRILVSLGKRGGCDLVASIGHELQHAIEALSDPAVRSNEAIFFAFRGNGVSTSERFETTAARAMELKVATEACRDRDQGAMGPLRPSRPVAPVASA